MTELRILYGQALILVPVSDKFNELKNTDILHLFY